MFKINSFCRLLGFTVTSLLILSMITGSSGQACTAVWDVYTAISGGSITAPSDSANIVVNSQVTCTVSAATDTDRKYLSGAYTYPTDTITYTWSAKDPSQNDVGSWLNSINTGQSVTWIAPASTYENITIKCTISDDAQMDYGDTGTRDDTDLTPSVTVHVFDVSSYTSSPSTIMTGGIANSLHQSTITYTVTPSSITGNVAFSIVGSTGHSTAASISSTPVALSSGQAQTTLTSSDLVETITVRATFGNTYNDIQVTQTYSDEDSFTIDPSSLIADGESYGTVDYYIVMHGTSTPVEGHSISFEIVSVTDADGNPVTNQALWPDYCTITGSPSSTDSSGKATCTFEAGELRGTVTIKAYDNNVWQSE